jgi:hypothetical protein
LVLQGVDRVSCVAETGRAAAAALANPSVVAVKPPITATARVNVSVITPLLRGGQIWLFRRELATRVTVTTYERRH